MGNASPAVCCIVTNNYAADAACLADHVQDSNPDIPVYALVIGDVPAIPRTTLPTNLHWIPWSELLDEQERHAYVTRYSAFQLSCALRGLCHAHMHTATPHDRWVMLDGDMAVLSSLSPVWDQLETNEILLTPHCTKPVPLDQVIPYEVSVLDHGIYNGGFVAMRRGDESLAAAKWLASRLGEWCYQGPLRTTDPGLRFLRLFDDQLWLNLIPIYFDKVFLLRDEVFNLGHWNLYQGTLEYRDSSSTFDGRPVIVAHFSGVDRHCPEKVSRHSRLYEKRPSQAWADLFRQYDRRRSRWLETFGPLRYTYERHLPKEPSRGLRRLARGVRRWLRGEARRLMKQ